MKRSSEIKQEIRELQTLLKQTLQQEVATGRDPLSLLVAGKKVPIRLETENVSISGDDGPNAEIVIRRNGIAIDGGIQLSDGTEIARFAM